MSSIDQTEFGVWWMLLYHCMSVLTFCWLFLPGVWEILLLHFPSPQWPGAEDEWGECWFLYLKNPVIVFVFFLIFVFPIHLGKTCTCIGLSLWVYYPCVSECSIQWCPKTSCADIWGYWQLIVSLLFVEDQKLRGWHASQNRGMFRLVIPCSK